jgi:hypothetical protein
MFKVDDMESIIQHYFTGMSPLPADVASGLRRFEGRPTHFCDVLLAEVLARTESDIRQRWGPAMDSAWSKVMATMVERLEDTFLSTPTSRRDVSAGGMSSETLAQLCHAVMLRGGLFRSPVTATAKSLVEKGCWCGSLVTRTWTSAPNPPLSQRCVRCARRR